MPKIAMGLLIALLTVACSGESFADISGGAGNTPVPDPGWPKGAEAIFNHKGRIAWWEGPPFGGGQWHADCRGDAKALSAVLVDFAKLDAKIKRIVLHDGAGGSFWLAPNREPEKLAAAKIDWSFMVWQPASWEMLRKMPADFNPTDPDDASPPSQIDVYTADIRWADVAVPKGIEVVDQRLESHGFTIADGAVFEGKATDLATARPIAATARLERVESQKSGGYLYPVAAEARADAQGRWVLKKAPAGWLRVVVAADGYAPRVVGYARIDDQPGWRSYDCGLSRAASISGRVVDEDGKPLADVDVRLGHVGPGAGGRYESPVGYKFKSDADGRFRVESAPAGKATIFIRKPGYNGPALGLAIEAPKDDVEMRMTRSAGVRVTVDFGGKQPPAGYLVEMEPEGGNVVGSYGGSGQIDDKNQFAFKDVPPGRYILRCHPNPSSADQVSAPVAVDLKSGQTAEVTLKAK